MYPIHATDLKKGYRMTESQIEHTVEPVDSYRAIRVDVPKNLDNIRVILVESQEPGNIGSAARAIKGMGLSRLYLEHVCRRHYGLLPY